MSGDDKGLGIILDFERDVIGNEQITEILQEGILGEYSEVYLMDYNYDESVFIHQDTHGKLEINVSVTRYPENFKALD